MNKVRSRIRARSIVGLYRDATIESLPIDEVKEDLARMGIDPAPTIRFAKVLADRGAEDPAVQLLQKIEKADAVDSEISDIERASIDDILSSLPAPSIAEAGRPASKSEKTVVEEVEKTTPEEEGERASTPDMMGFALNETAEIRADEAEKVETDKKAGTDAKAETAEEAETSAEAGINEKAETDEADEIELVENTEAIKEESVVPLWKRDRKSVLRLGGALVGIAASLLILVAIGPGILDRVTSSNEQDVQRADNTFGEDAVVSTILEEEELVATVEAPIEVTDETVALSSAVSARQLQEPLANVDVKPEESEVERLEARLESIDNLAAAEAGAFAGQVAGVLTADVDERAAALVVDERQPALPESSASPSAGAFATLGTADEGEPKLAARSPGSSGNVANAAKPEIRAPSSSYVPIIVPPPSTEPTVEAKAPPRLELDQAAQAPAIAPLPKVETPPLGPANLTGIFIVDANRVPAELIALAASKRDDRLAAKLGEASLRALGRKVAALVAIERGGERVEAALVELEGEKLPRESDAVIEFFSDGRAVNLEGWTRSVELLELPNRR